MLRVSDNSDSVSAASASENSGYSIVDEAESESECSYLDISVSEMQELSKTD